MSMTHIPAPKALTYDQRKAADAAFNGRPFNEAWSASARAIYDGLVKVLSHRDFAVPDRSTLEPSAEAHPIESEALQPLESPAHEEIGREESAEEGTAMPPTLGDRDAAIQAGILIDVTPTALQLGITFPVTMTRKLWEMGQTMDRSLSEEDHTKRLRDILMAFRLRLASLTTLSPLLDFPALLTLPPNQVPQPVPLFALIQPDPTHQAQVTLLLPNEVALSINSLN